MVADPLGATLWAASAPPAPALPPLRGDSQTDVAVVGGGILGLSCALHLAERGVAVTVLEAGAPGLGASGRSTGFVVPSLYASLDRATVAGVLGEDHAARFLAFVAGSGAAVFDLIARHGLAAAAETTAWVHPAASPAWAARLRARREEWAALGKSVDWLDAAEVTALTGVPGYHGALLDRSGGQLNPLAYARELGRAATACGAEVYADSPVLQLERDGAAWRLRTPAGELRAARVLLATNALTGQLWPALARASLPVTAYQMATAPLAEADQARILPERWCLSDTRRHPFALRWSADGRLVTGGLVFGGPAKLARARRGFLKRLARLVPDLPVVQSSFVWRGTIAATPHRLPLYLDLAPGLESLVACNGRGIALTTALGQALAASYVGETDATAFPLPLRPPAAYAARLLGPAAPSLWLAKAGLLERWN